MAKLTWLNVTDLYILFWLDHLVLFHSVWPAKVPRFAT